ncbi:MAG: hypothetical protein KF897_05985 [Opitutaceae bacterium]|nr:hypothetical protein [Opitutaceae bacterium]
MAAGIAGVVVFGVAALFRSPETVKDEGDMGNFTGGRGGVTMGLTRLDPNAGNALLNEEAMLFDPTPLFLPTEWNVGHNTLPDNLMRDMGHSFHDYPAQLTFNEVGVALGFPAPVEVPAKVTDVLPMLGRQQPFAGMGRTDAAVATLPERGARVDVMAAKDGAEALSLTIPVEQLPTGLWQPMEFLLAVDAAGLVGPPVLMVQASDERLVATLQEILAKTLHLGERLGPGIYRVCVGP